MPVSAFWKFLQLGNSVWNFWGVKFWSRDSFWFWFLPPIDHPCHLKSRVRPWVPPSPSPSNAVLLCCCTVWATSKLYSNKHHNIEWWEEGRRADCFFPQEPHLKTVCQHFVSDCSLLKLSPPRRFECQNVFHEHWLRQRRMQITFFRRFLVEK